MTTLAAGTGTVKLPYIYHYFSPLMLEFTIGIIIGAAFLSNVQVSKKASMLMIFASLLLLLSKSNGTADSQFLELGLPWAAIVFAARVFDTSKLIDNWLVQFLGDASYSIYLVHPFPIWFLIKYLR